MGMVYLDNPDTEPSPAFYYFKFEKNQFIYQKTGTIPSSTSKEESPKNKSPDSMCGQCMKLVDSPPQLARKYETSQISRGKTARGACTRKTTASHWNN
jgi:hypothetical protein